MIFGRHEYSPALSNAERMETGFMRATVFLATSAIVLIMGLAAFVHTREVSSPPAVQLVATNSAAADRSARRAQRAAATTALLPEETSTNELSATNLYVRFTKGDIPRVSREQLEPYLAQHHRSVDALLGALRASGDDALLKEAKERFPDDPRVQFAAAFKSESAEERQAWLEKFKQSDPDNSLGSYLLAGEHFKAGQTGQALQELATAAGKAGFNNHLLDFIQNTEEAYQAAGYSEAEAKGVACNSALLPELLPFKQVGQALVELAKRYEQAGDAASAQAVRDMGLNLGRRLEQPPQVTLIHELVGRAIERMVLGSMNRNTPYGATGQTVQNQMDALAVRRKQDSALFAQAEPLLNTMSDQDLTHYYDRLKIYGEVSALRWVINQAPQP